VQKEKRIKQWHKVVLICLAALVVAGGAFFAVIFWNGQNDTAAAEHTQVISVEFAPLTTTSEEYDRLYAVCREYAQTLVAQDSAGMNVEIQEDTFVDAAVSSEESEQPVLNAGYVEYDRAYFENLLLVRYVSESGDIHLVAAQQSGRDQEEVELLLQEDFNYEQFHVVEIDNWLTAFKFKKEMRTAGVIEEDIFMNCVGRCLVVLLTDGESIDYRDHFTQDGSKSVLRIRQLLQIENGTVEVVLSAAGKSALEQETMDRIYLRCGVTIDGNSDYVDILLKLNDDMMIYDVDLI